MNPSTGGWDCTKAHGAARGTPSRTDLCAWGVGRRLPQPNGTVPRAAWAAPIMGGAVWDLRPVLLVAICRQVPTEMRFKYLGLVKTENGRAPFLLGPGELIYSVKSPSLSADSRGGLMPSIGGAEPMHTP